MSDLKQGKTVFQCNPAMPFISPSTNKYHDKLSKDHPPFHLLDLNAPNVSGLPLILLAKLLEHPTFGYLFRRRFFSTSGFAAFRTRASGTQHIEVEPCDLPIYYPLPEPTPRPHLSQIDTLFHALYPSDFEATSRRPSISDYYNAYSNNRVTPLQVAETILAQIKASNEPPHSLNAIISTNPEELLAAARESSARWKSATPLSVVDGVPFSVKQMLDAAGHTTSSACSLPDPITQPNVAALQDADVVKSLRHAGMMMIGKTNQDELGIGVRGFSIYTGQTRNPQNFNLVPGGSSSGSAATVAAGLCPVSIGTDAGGSIRIPAACCGAYGLKPTFARLSTHGRVWTARDESVDEVGLTMTTGPIAGCARDLALSYYLMAAFAPHRKIRGQPQFEENVRIQIPKSIGSSLEGMRVGVYMSWLESGTGIGADVALEVLSAMKESGAVEVPIVIPDLEDIRVALSISIMDSSLRKMHEIGFSQGDISKSIGYDARAKLAMVQEFNETDVNNTKVVRAKAMRYAVEHIFKEVDLVLTPALGTEVPPVPFNLETGVTDVQTESRMMRFMLYASYTGLPACVFPVRREDSGAPCAVQLIGGPYCEEQLLQVTMWGEQTFPSGFDPPKVVNALDSLTAC